MMNDSLPTPLKVLIVEDDPVDADLMVHRLNKEGFNSDWTRVETEQQFIDALESDYDLVLADWNLPQFSGLRALHMVTERKPDIPFIIVSGGIGEEAAVASMRQGATDYLLKDRLERLGQAVRHALEQKQVQAQYRQSQEALAASEAELRALFAGLHDVVMVLGSEGVYRKIAPTNPGGLVRPAEELVGKSLFEIFPEATAQGFLQTIHQALETQKTTSYEYQVKILNQPVWFEASISPMTAREVIWVAHDITERKRGEASIRLQVAALASAATPRQTLTVALEQLIAFLGVDAAAFLRFYPQTETLEFAEGHGFLTPVIEKTRLQMGQSLAGKVAQDRRIIYQNGPRGDASFLSTTEWKPEGFTCYVGVPMVVNSRLIGVCEVFHRSALVQDADWLRSLETITGQAALVIDHLQIFEELQRANQELLEAYDATIEGWSRAMDLRDEGTENHSRRVTELTLRLARRLGIEDHDQLVQLRRGALLHDIGKLGIPDNILKKADVLTDEERGIMRRHPRLGYDMLYPIEYLRPAIDIPYCHHEKWDGSGYPRGLKGEQIPFAARLFAVADVFDALTSDRPYRLAWTQQQALNYIQAESGRHFDPQVVEAFLSLWRTGILKQVY